MKKSGNIIVKEPQGVLTIIMQKISSFLWDLRGRQRQTFQKINVFRWQKFWPIFLCDIEYDKPQGTSCKGPQTVPTNTVLLARAFFKDQGLLKSQFFFFLKRQFSSERKNLVSFFRVISSVKNLKGLTVKVQQVFRQILWK